MIIDNSIVDRQGITLLWTVWKEKGERSRSQQNQFAADERR
jgi:hypothetical protein